ncbi:hypothetical protein VKT23_013569 [Stygiomarasmius scandens]|uniref:F-box domain-containing protein n=1 Tax=Marasmiellus scandens TaxID=2682957 RepID=A0ABR1J2U5_9AGAR
MPLGSGSVEFLYPPIDVKRFRAYPSDFEIWDVRQQIHDGQNEIDQLDEEINCVCKNFWLLQERRDRIRRRVDEYRAFVSPIRRIPPEIWNEIFIRCLHDSHGLCITDTEIFAPTMDLSQVCGSWRETVTSTPKLWADLDINLIRGGPETAARVALYLEHSGDSPLILNVQALDGNLQGVENLDRSWVWKTLEMLLNNHTRWYKVKVNLLWEILDHKEVQNLFQNISTHCDVLQYISVVFGNAFPPQIHEYSPALFQILKQAPQLQSLHLDEFGPFLNLPFFQLLDITVSAFWSWADILKCLSMCPSLQKADITIEEIEDDDPEFKKFCHVELRSFKCTFSCVWHVNDVLSALMLPAINELELSVTNPDSESDGAGLKNMLSQSSCQLETLKLNGFYTSEQELINILFIIPTLLHFELDSVSFTTAFFQNLTFQDGITAILPRLTSFSISIRGSPTDPPLPDPKAILLMVRSRRPVKDTQERARLTHFDFVVSGPVDIVDEEWLELFSSEVVPSLRALESEGLELKLEIGSE